MDADINRTHFAISLCSKNESTRTNYLMTKRNLEIDSCLTFLFQTKNKLHDLSPMNSK